MKRGCLLLLFLLLFSGMAVAAEITATAVTSTGDYNNKTFFCTGTNTLSMNINKAELLFDVSGSMEVNETNTTFTAAESVEPTFYVTEIPAGTYNWQCRVYLTNNSNATSSSKSFTANIAPEFSGTLPDVTIAEDTSNSSCFDLDDFFSDTDTLTYSYSGSSPIDTYVEVTIGSGNVVTIAGTKNWSSTATLTFTASDGSLTTDSNTITVNVTPVNDAPYLSEDIPSQNWSSNTNKTIDLGDYFADEDSSTLNYTVSTEPSHITVYISGDTATLVPETDWSGTTTVVFRASDSSLYVDSNTTELNVGVNGTSSNSAPSIDSRSPVLPAVSMEVGDQKVFSITKSDANDDDMTVEWFLDGDKISGETSNSYTYKAEKGGKYKLKVSVSDGELATTYTWTINVLAEDETNTSAETTSTIDSPVPATYEQSPLCGDGKIDEGENCLTCEADASCAANEVCDEGVCNKKPTWWKTVVLIILILGVLGAGGYLVYYFISKRRQHKSDMSSSERSFSEKRLGSGIEIAPASDFSDFLSKKERQLKGDEGKKKEIDDDMPDPIVMLKGFVKKMRADQRSDAEIKAKLKSKGWKGKQIDEAME